MCLPLRCPPAVSCPCSFCNIFFFFFFFWISVCIPRSDTAEHLLRRRGFAKTSFHKQGRAEWSWEFLNRQGFGPSVRDGWVMSGKVRARCILKTTPFIFLGGTARDEPRVLRLSSTPFNASGTKTQGNRTFFFFFFSYNLKIADSPASTFWKSE